eukprot:COSAG01_NODE_7021_length_3389_cov_5.565350_3_plen_57_part_00
MSSDQVEELIRDGDKVCDTPSHGTTAGLIAAAMSACAQYRTGEISFDFFARMVSQI